MTFSNYTLAVLYLMAVIGLWSVSLVPAVPPLFAAAGAVAVALSLILNIRKKEVISVRLWGWLAAGVVIFFTADYFALEGSLVGSASKALTILLALKLFDIKTGRDYITVYAIVFFQLLAAAASTVSPVFFLILALFIIDVIFAMTIFNIKKDMLSASQSGAEPPPGLLDTPFFVSIIVVSVASIIITFALFFIMPRMGAGFFERKTADTVKVSGFSERVELGTLGRVLLDPAVVMRVEVAGKDLQGLRRPLHFRGTALDTYDGASWSRKIKGLRMLKKDPAGLFHTAPPNPGANLLQQDILLEPLDTDVIFAAGRPVAAAGRFPVLKTDESGAVFMESAPYSRIQYRAWSDMSPSWAPPGEAAPEFLDASSVTKGAAGERLKSLIADVLKGRATEIEKARAIEAHLLGGYGYSLDPKKGTGLSPLDDFLFFSKLGYCEHYATAMAMMLRAAGIPARIVIGFSEGEWNGYGGYFIVRQSDAHSWVEARIKGGWMTFDPTPAPIDSIGGYGKPGRLGLYLDMLRFRWDRYIVNYTLADQKRLTGTIESLTSRLYFSVKRWWILGVRSTGKRLNAVSTLAAALLAAWAFFRLRKKRAGPTASKTPAYYREMLMALERQGRMRKDAETPMEFAGRVASPHVHEVTAIFQEERYGGRRPGPDGERRVKSAIEAIGRKAV